MGTRLRRWTCIESEGEAGMNIEKIEILLNNSEGLSDYKINSTRTESYELFFVHKALETVRATDTESTTITVYVDHDGKRGSSSFSIYASTTEDEAKIKIDDAVKKALLVNNEMYTLPEGELLDGEIESNFADYDMAEAGRMIAEAVFDANTLEFGTINALEIFVNRHTSMVKNSRGIDKKAISYSAMVEAIPTWNEGESVELYACKKMSTLDKAWITNEINEKMIEVRERCRAVKPEEKISCRVMLDAEELSSLISNLIYELDYSSVYSGSNFYSIGDEVQKDPQYDKLTVTMRGTIEGSVSSALFDGDGVTLIDTEIIKEGRASSYFGSHRFAQYLSKNATGSLPCIELEAGTLTDKEITCAPYFRCVSMSGVQVDLYNDYIGGEVRLAYYFDGEKTIPLSGITISGSLSKALSSVKLSSVTVTVGKYKGPKCAIFEGIEIV